MNFGTQPDERVQKLIDKFLYGGCADIESLPSECFTISESRQGLHDCSMFLRHRTQSNYRSLDKNLS